MGTSFQRNNGSRNIVMFTMMSFTLLSFNVGILERMMPSSFTAMPTNDIAGGTAQTFSTGRRQSKLGDGCYHVFIDVGSNIGIHARFLYEPEKYPDSTTSVKAFEHQFGLQRDNRDYCVFAFEPNPKFKQRHLDMEKAYNAIGWHYKPFIAGVSNEDGNFTFYHSHIQGEGETGFNAVASKTLYGTDADKTVVEITRLSTWIQREIEGRLIPLLCHAEQCFEPKVIMKLDVEGLEYMVFPDLVTTGALCNNINFLMGEFHYGPSHSNYFPINVTSDGRHVLHSRNQGALMSDQLLHFVDLADTCMTKISLQDDEAYRLDPHELPRLNDTAKILS